MLQNVEITKTADRHKLQMFCNTNYQDNQVEPIFLVLVWSGSGLGLVKISLG